MPSPFRVSAEAQSDLIDIWRHIAEDSVELADRIDREFDELFAALARMPSMGHSRKELTKRPLLFFPMYSFMVIYRKDVRPIRIIAVLRGRRNLKRIIKARL
jgi:plasmid stabilization system protein ParE